MIKPELIRGLFERAAEEEMGVAIQTNNPHRLATEIHKWRKETAEYKDIIIATPPGNEIFLVKETVDLQT